MIQVVVDIGNTRIKWARCSHAGIDAHVSLPPDDPDAWAKQAILNVAFSGKFSSDRTIREYATQIWTVPAVRVP